MAGRLGRAQKRTAGIYSSLPRASLDQQKSKHGGLPRRIPTGMILAMTQV
jgi:hypothetical protein